MCLCVGLLSILNLEASQLKRIVRWHFTSHLILLSLLWLRSLIFRIERKKRRWSGIMKTLAMGIQSREAKIVLSLSSIAHLFSSYRSYQATKMH